MASKATAVNALRKLANARQALQNAVMAAAKEYANGGFRAAPIVRRHFTDGNAGRYGWPPLSARYAAVKAGQTKQLKKGMRAVGKAVPKGAGLPMLVRTGALRDAVAAGRAVIIARPDGSVTIRWTGLPAYARYHHTGSGRLPKRSPVEPNAEDRAEMIAAARRYLSAAIGTGAANVPAPQVAGGMGVPGGAAGRARVF